MLTSLSVFSVSRTVFSDMASIKLLNQSLCSRELGKGDGVPLAAILPDNLLRLIRFNRRLHSRFFYF